MTALDSSRDIIDRALAEIEPYAIVAMISGGKDSLCAYLVAKALGVPVTHILHGVTGTGIAETTEFVRDFAGSEKACLSRGQCRHELCGLCAAQRLFWTRHVGA